MQRSPKDLAAEGYRSHIVRETERERERESRERKEEDIRCLRQERLFLDQPISYTRYYLVVSYIYIYMYMS